MTRSCPACLDLPRYWPDSLKPSALLMHGARRGRDPGDFSVIKCYLPTALSTRRNT